MAPASVLLALFLVLAVASSIFFVEKAKNFSSMDNMTTLRTSDWEIVNFLFLKHQALEMKHVSTVTNQRRNSDGTILRCGERDPAKNANDLR